MKITEIITEIAGATLEHNEDVASDPTKKNEKRKDPARFWDKAPTELLIAIMETLELEDVGSMRLVKKRLGDIGRHLLCRNVHVMETDSSYNRALEIAGEDEEIRDSVQHLNLIPTDTVHAPCYEFQVYVCFRKLMRLESFYKTQKLSAEELLPEYRKYTACLDDLAALSGDMNEKVKKMAYIVRKLKPKSITIGLSDQHAMGHKLYKNLYDERVMLFRGGYRRVFEELLFILAKFETGVELERLSFGLSPPSALKIMRDPEHVAQGLRYIKFMDVSLMLDPKDLTEADRRKQNQSFSDEEHFDVDATTFVYDEPFRRSLGQVLQAAQDLESLNLIAFGPQFHNQVSSLVIAENHWRKLKSCALTSVQCTHLELTRFVKTHVKTLKDLKLHDITLLKLDGEEDTMWWAVGWIDFMRSISQLTADNILYLENFLFTAKLHIQSDVGHDVCWNSKRCVGQPLVEVLAEYISERNAKIAGVRKRIDSAQGKSKSTDNSEPNNNSESNNSDSDSDSSDDESMTDDVGLMYWS